MAPTANSKVTLKLLIDNNNNRVLFAEAGKDFVDFLFSILSLPLATVTSLLSKTRMVGCVGNLYQSIEQLSDTFFQPGGESKATLLNHTKATFHTLASSSSDDNNASAVTSRKLYNCRNYDDDYCMGYVADDPRARCRGCGCEMNHQLTLAPPPAAVSDSGERGFVKGLVTYLVMDNLEVKTMSTISSIALLNEFNIQHLGDLEEKVVELGMDEGLKLLKASLQSKTVLTTVFLGARL